jgi:hypothetical protein
LSRLFESYLCESQIYFGKPESNLSGLNEAALSVGLTTQQKKVAFSTWLSPRIGEETLRVGAASAKADTLGNTGG